MLSGYRTYIALWLPVLAVLGAIVTHRAPPEIGWLAFAALVTRALDQTFMRLGIAKVSRRATVTMGGSKPPTKVRRTKSKKWAVILPLLLLPHTSACASKGYVSKAALRPSIVIVAKRHDAYVRKDPELTQSQRDRYLRTTTLLRKVVEEAPAE